MKCGLVFILLNILYLSNLSACFIKIRKKITQAMLLTKSNTGYFLGHSRASNSKKNSAILPEFKQDFMPVQVICNFHKDLGQVVCNFHKDPIKTKTAYAPDKVEYEGFYSTKGQITPESMFRSGQNSNLCKILCLSSLFSNFIKFQLKLSRLCSRQG